MRMEFVMERAATKRVRTPSAGRTIEVPNSLTSPSAKAAIAKLQKELIANPEKANEFFVSAGILTESGRLSKRFGGR
jgi:hypothetical protein